MKYNLFIIVILSLLITFPGVKPQESRDTTHITICADGSAFWELETRFELKTEVDRNFFKDYVEALEEEKSTMIEEKRAEIEDIINKLKLTVKRNMEIEDLDLNYGVIETVNKTYGVVKFQFLWKGFAEVEGDKLLIGDVFLGGYYLDKNETMIIDFPENFLCEHVFPSPDEIRKTTLIWYGPKDFGEKEPSIILSEHKVSTETNISKKTEEDNQIGYLIVIAGIILFIIVYFLKIRKKNIEEDFFMDEDIVINILNKNGGKCFQNKIVEESGFSKSKISNIINKMEKDGKITKKKIGRNNLIILNDF